MAHQKPTNATPPSRRQLDVMRCIERHRQLHGYSPTIRELGDELGIRSTNGVHDLVRALVRKGLVTKPPNTSRTLMITDAGRAWLPREAA